jgi:hypothetical protein
MTVVLPPTWQLPAGPKMEVASQKAIQGPARTSPPRPSDEHNEAASPGKMGFRMLRGTSAHLRANRDRIVETLVVGTIAGIAFAASASHVLTLGRAHQVVGWHAWSVGGTVEILAAYAGLESRRRQGLARVLPGLVFVVAASFMILANLAVEPDAWAARLLPWGQVYSAVPPVAFLAVALIVETKNVRGPSFRGRRSAGQGHGKAQVTAGSRGSTKGPSASAAMLRKKGVRSRDAAPLGPR